MQTINPELNMRVLAGILTGLLAGFLYNRFHNILLPEFLAFFGGKRFVPIATGLTCLIIGVAMALCQIPGIKIGFTFSAGLIDYVLSFGISSRPLLMLPIGVLWAVVYYVLFRFFISRFNLATPGREESDQPISPPVISTDRATAYLLALGGKQNLTRIDACITRLRLEIVSMNDVQETELKKLGATGVVKRGDSGLQIIVGTQAEIIAGEIRELINQ